MSRAYQANQLHRWFRELLHLGDAGGLVTGEGEVLALRYETLADIGTLSATAATVAKYFPLGDGDAVILNDPYSGGSLLSTMSVVTPLLIDPFPIYWVMRTGFKPMLVISEKLDEEGLRIPPTPLVQKRQINQAILAAMTSHPNCPAGFSARMNQIIPSMFARIDAFRLMAAKNKELFTKPSLKFYQKLSHDWVIQSLHDYPHGEAKVETYIDSDEVIKLRAELAEGQLKLDFSGTSASKRLCLTDVATFGACVGALGAFLQKDIPLNSGFFSFVDVVAPLGCLLNSKYPSPTFRGMTEGASIVASTVVQALSEIVPAKKTSLGAGTPTMVSFEFDKGLVFFDPIFGGSGASSSKEGVDGVQYWIRNKLQPSVEEIERRYPLMIRQTRLRMGSGGKGQFRGGNGITKEYELLWPANMCWSMKRKRLLAPGQKGAHNGLVPEITIHKKDGKEIVLEENQGIVVLEAGDRVFVSSGGGGGFGKANHEKS